MNAITKVSEITADDIAEYLRIPETTADDIKFINLSLSVAKNYICKFTGIETVEELDSYPDITIVVFVLCQDMFDTRTLYTDSSNVNRVVESILGLYRRNLL